MKGSLSDMQDKKEFRSPVTLVLGPVLIRKLDLPKKEKNQFTKTKKSNKLPKNTM